MKPSRLALLFLAAAIFGCAHPITEQELVGKWTRDPAKPGITANTAKMILNLSADMNFVLETGTGVSVKGTWSLDKDTKKVGVTAKDLVIANPADPTHPMVMALTQALQVMQERNADPEMIKGLQEVSREGFFEPSADGKKMSENGQPSWIKGT